MVMPTVLMPGLPEQSASDPDEFSYHARHVSQWVQGLPMGNIGVAGKLLYGRLRKLNRVKVTPKERLNFLQQTAPLVEQVVEAMDEHISGKSFPLTPKQRKIGVATRDFYRELALGYRSVIVDMQNRDGTFSLLHKKGAARAMVQSMVYCRKALLRCYQTYSSYPGGLWQAIHGLYHYASSRNLTQRSHTTNEGSFSGTLQELYTQILLLAAANPFRLRQQEILELDQFLKEQLVPLEFVSCSGTEVSTDAGIFIVQGADSPPLHFVDDLAEESGGLLLLDLTPFNQSLKLLIEKTTKGSRTKDVRIGGMNVSLLRQIMTGWGSVMERGHDRMPAGHRLEAVFGIHAIHNVVAGNRDFETFLADTGVSIDSGGSGKMASWAAASSDHYKASRSFCSALDQSLGGYRLSWGEEQKMRAKVGEPIAVSQPVMDGEERDWVLGMVRWLSVQRDGSVEVGMELVARHADAIAVRLPKLSAASESIIRGIYVPAEFTRERSGSLLMTSAVLARGVRRVELIRRDENIQIGVLPEETVAAITERLEEGPACGIYRFSEAEEESGDEKLEEPAGIQEQPVWDGM